jgi:hypothetical protein
MAQTFREEVQAFVNDVNRMLEQQYSEYTPHYFPLTLREGRKWAFLYSEHRKVPYLKLDRDLNIYTPNGKKVLANVRNPGDWSRHIGPDGLKRPS